MKSAKKSKETSSGLRAEIKRLNAVLDEQYSPELKETHEAEIAELKNQVEAWKKSYADVCADSLRARDDGFVVGQHLMKERAAVVAHEIGVEEGQPPGSSWSFRIEANIKQVAITKSAVDASKGWKSWKQTLDEAREAAKKEDQVTKCCERDHDNDGNCDKHPEEDPRGCPEETKPAINIEVWQRCFEKLLGNDNFMFSVLREETLASSRDDSPPLSDKMAKRVTVFVSKVADEAYDAILVRARGKR